jgi:hypothetical protein
MNDTTNNNTKAAWSKAKSIRETHGITAPQLRRYAQAGMIRTSNLRLPGQTRGSRLFNMEDVDRLIEKSIERHAPPRRMPRSLSDD